MKMISNIFGLICVLGFCFVIGIILILKDCLDYKEEQFEKEGK